MRWGEGCICQAGGQVRGHVADARHRRGQRAERTRASKVRVAARPVVLVRRLEVKVLERVFPLVLAVVRERPRRIRVGDAAVFDVEGEHIVIITVVFPQAWPLVQARAVDFPARGARRPHHRPRDLRAVVGGPRRGPPAGAHDRWRHDVRELRGSRLPGAAKA